MISKKSVVGSGTVFGEYCVVEDGAVIGSDCVFGHHVVVHSGTCIGDSVRVDDFACIGKLPMRAANSAVTGEAPVSPASVGSCCIIGTHAVVYAGCEIAPRVLIADHATIREDVAIGEKTIIGRGVAVENHCRIGALCKIETGAYIAAYSFLEDSCFVAPGVVTSNDNFAGRTKERFSAYKGVTVRKGGRIGAGAVILPGREIEPDGFAAAGSVVTRDIKEGEIAAGSPAHPLKKVPENQLLKNQE